MWVHYTPDYAGGGRKGITDVAISAVAATATTI
jgi:hypothetical protein